MNAYAFTVKALIKSELCLLILMRFSQSFLLPDIEMNKMERKEVHLR